MPDEHVDILIVGAGLSGIGAACRLRQRCPGKTFAILEARGAIGGTWDLFRFPGIRSDSDMYTLSYPFRPWSGGQALADGATILGYVRETAREHGVDGAIRFHHRVAAAEWSTADTRWTVDVERSDTGERARLTCGFLYVCTGYYRYDAGHTPALPGMERYRGDIVHPQLWRDEVDHAGKRVVVIGSGATAITLVPALARRAAHVTMLQRSPSYVISLPADDVVARVIERVLPRRLAYRLVRWKNMRIALALYALCRRRPALMRRLHRALLKWRLPRGFDVDTHFNPSYEPWDQRLCIVLGGDLYEAIGEGRASVVTDRIASFTERGLALESGGELEAEVIVTATGLEMVPLGDIRFRVDGRDVDLAATFAYRGMQLSGVPNLAFAFGYSNQSWTLGADLTSEHVCRLLAHMDRAGHAVCTPRSPGPGVAPQPFAELTSGYVLRAIDRFPRQGPEEPWRREQHHPRNVRALRRDPLADPALEFTPAHAPPSTPSPLDPGRIAAGSKAEA